jgi:hypothetical protein
MTEVDTKPRKRWGLRIIVGFLFLLLLAGVLMQTKSVQNFIGHQVARWVSDQWGYPVRIAQLNISFFDNISLGGVYVEDTDQDTLFYLHQLQVEIDDISLRHQSLQIENIQIREGLLDMKRSATDSLFNLNHFLLALTGPPSNEPSQPSPPPSWLGVVKTITLENLTFRMQDAWAGNETNSHLQRSTLRNLTLDLSGQCVTIDQWSLSDSDFGIQVFNGTQPILPSPPTELNYPYFGWDIHLHQLLFWNNRIRFDNREIAASEQSPDLNHLDANLDTLDLRNLAWTADQFDLRLQHLFLSEANGFKVQELAAQVEMSPTSIYLKELLLLTPGSRFRASSQLTFETWNALQNDLESIEVTAIVSPSYLRIGDVVPFLPPSLTGVVQARPEELLVVEMQAQGSLRELLLSTLHLKAGEAAELSLSGVVRELLQTQSTAGELKTFFLRSNPADLKRWLPSLPLPKGSESLQTIEVKGQLAGSLQSLQADSLTVRTGIGTRLAVNATIEAPLDTALRFSLLVLDLTTHPDHWQPFLSDPLPPELIRMGTLTFAGNLAGGRFQQAITGVFNTQAGTLSPDLNIQFSPDYKDAEYRGDLRVDQLDLGHILGAPEQFGLLSADLNLSGHGLTPDSMKVQGEGNVHSLGLAGYNYRKLSFQALWNQNLGKLKADLADANLQFSLDAMGDLRTSLPTFQIDLILDTLVADQLNMWPEPLAGSGKITGNWEGLAPDEITGSIHLADWFVSNDSAMYSWQTADLQMVSDSSYKMAKLRAPFLDLKLEGAYSYAQLPQELITQLAPYLPGIAPTQPSPQDSLDTADAPSNWVLNGQSWELYELISILDPNLSRLENFTLNAASDPKEGIELDFKLPGVAYQGLELQHLSWMIRETPDKRLRSDLLIDSLTFQDSFLHDLHWQIVGRLDTLFSDIRLGDYEVPQRLRTSGRLTTSSDYWKYEVLPPFFLNGQTWEVDSLASIGWADDWYAQQVGITRNNQSIRLQSDSTFASTKHTLNIQGFQLEEITELSGWATHTITGNMGGYFTWQTNPQRPIYTADLSLQDLTLDEETIGTLHADASQTARTPVLNLGAQLEGADNQFNLKGTYHLNKQTLDINTQIDQFQMRLLDIFAGSDIRDSRGTFSGSMDIGGTTSSPELEGFIALNGISTFVEMMQTRYSLGQDTIFIHPNQVFLPRLAIQDMKGRKAIMNGQVRHQQFQEIDLDLGLKTDRFQLFDTTPEENDLFYGTLFLGMDLKMTGSPEAPSIKINASTQEATNLTLVTPANSDPSVSEGNFIIYGNPEAGRDSLTTETAQYTAKTKGIDLLMQLAVDPEAQVKVIIDPTTGDYLQCRGKADITTKMDPQGNISLLGTYLLEEGRYSLNYENVFKREFELEQGSQITFVGDPMDSRFDITAVYSTKTSYYDLLRNEMTLSDEETRAAQRRQEVEVVMHIKGDLELPELSFDIRLPEKEKSSPLAGAIESKLARLRQKETDLNTQVFGLLLFNNFITTQRSASTLSGTTEALALSSASKLITQQLNRLANRHLKGVDVNIGVDSYQAETDMADQTITEVQLGLSKKAFNDRLTIEVGGNLDLTSQEGQTQFADFTTIAGDFVLDYQLDAEGRYHVQVFQKSQYDLINESNSNKTGVGFSFRKAFNRKRQRYEAILED